MTNEEVSFMNRLITLLILLCVLVVFTAGCHKAEPTTSATNGKLVYQADWPHYSAVPALVDAVTDVFTGKIVDIYFEVLDVETGKVVNAPVEDGWLLLYTIYEIEIIESYKGNPVERQYIAVMGGVPGYNEPMQIQALKDCGIYDENAEIPVLANSEVLEMGVEYLFAASDLGVDYLRIPNPEQYAFAIQEDSVGADAMMPTYESIIQYFEALA